MGQPRGLHSRAPPRGGLGEAALDPLWDSRCPCSTSWEAPSPLTARAEYEKNWAGVLVEPRTPRVAEAPVVLS